MLQQAADFMQTILIIDDETSFLNIIQLILGRAGYQVLTATDGKDGLSKARTLRPDLVMLDDMLPGMNGGEICAAIKNDPDMEQTPVIFYSAGNRVSDENFIRQIRADATLHKPFKPQDVLKTVQTCLQAAF